MSPEGLDAFPCRLRTIGIVRHLQQSDPRTVEGQGMSSRAAVVIPDARGHDAVSTPALIAIPGAAALARDGNTRREESG